MATPYKMKGSPMQRNFGIGSPLHDHKKDKDGNIIKHPTLEPTAKDTLLAELHQNRPITDFEPHNRSSKAAIAADEKLKGHKVTYNEKIKAIKSYRKQQRN